jgi:hypothetical protein
MKNKLTKITPELLNNISKINRSIKRIMSAGSGGTHLQFQHLGG